MSIGARHFFFCILPFFFSSRFYFLFQLFSSNSAIWLHSLPSICHHFICLMYGLSLATDTYLLSKVLSFPFSASFSFCIHSILFRTFSLVLHRSVCSLFQTLVSHLQHPPFAVTQPATCHFFLLSYFTVFFSRPEVQYQACIRVKIIFSYSPYFVPISMCN